MSDACGRAQVLLVEDNRDNCEVLTVILSEKYRVASYTSAGEALAALDAVRPDLLLLDIGMKPVDGVECLRTIRATPGYSRVPAVALTGYARDIDKRDFLAAGFQAVVAKPVLDYERLETVIDTLLVSGCSLARPSGGTPAGQEILTGAFDGSMIGGRGGNET